MSLILPRRSNDVKLFFPAFHPFAADTVLDGNQSNLLKGSLGEGKMYFSTQRTQISNDSRFTIEVDYSNQSSTINLGFMIVEGSEQSSFHCQDKFEIHHGPPLVFRRIIIVACPTKGNAWTCGAAICTT